MCGSESKKRSRDQSERAGWEKKGCRREEEEEEENVGVSLTTLRWDTRERYCLFGEHWRIPDYRTWVQEGTPRKQYRLLIFQKG